MVIAARCPDASILEKFALGQMLPEEVEPLALHVEQCERCTQVLNGMKAEDTLIEAMSARSTAADEDNDKVDALIERLKALSAPDMAPRVEHTVTTVADDTPSSERRLDQGEDTPVPLSPAQGPDEIGRLAHYRVLKLLGSGGMGLVYLAEDAHLQRPVALKIMKPEAAKNRTARERFLREARAAARLKSDHVVTIHQVGEDRDIVFLAMEFLEGTSLEDWLKQTPRPSVGQAASIGRQIALGLAAAHERGLIHRDVKPGNIWLEDRESRIEDRESRIENRESKGITPDPRSSILDPQSSNLRVKLLDFGLARAGDADDQHLTQSGTIVGTPAYMAPEQARSEKIDARADLFSLGVVLYRLCTGRLPFRGENTMSILTSLAVDTPAPPREINPEIPPRLATLIERLLAKDRTQRPASARAVADELAAIERAQTEAAKPPAAASIVDEATIAGASPAAPAPPAEPQPLPAPAPSPVRRRWLIAAAVLLAVLGAATFFFGGTVIRVVTNKGELIVQVDDDRVEVVVKQNGVEVRDKTQDRTFVLTAGKGEVEFFDPDTGVKMTTRRFSLSRGGRDRVSVRMAEVAVKPALPTNADRKAAEWVLSVGGYCSSKTQLIGQFPGGGPFREIPKQPFELVSVWLRHHRVGDAGLVHLDELKYLASLNLDDTGVTDAGLGHLKRHKNLVELYLQTLTVTDGGLKHLSALTKLQKLDLGRTHVSDAGLVHLKTLTNLKVLYLDKDDRRIGQISDAGMEHLRALTNLTELKLEYTNVSDAGLKHLTDLKNLKFLGLNGTKVTSDGVRKLQAALPNCNISSDFSDSDRKAAEWVLSMGGGVTIRQDGQAKLIQTAKEMPATAFEVLEVGLRGTKADDGGLANLEGLTNLHRLALWDTQITDHGLAHLKGLTKLGILSLQGTRVSDAGLEHLQGLKNLHELSLIGTRITGAGLKHLKRVPVTHLYLNATRVDDRGLEHLETLTSLYFVDLSQTRVTGDGLTHLKTLTSLSGLQLGATQVTDAGLKHLEGLVKLTVLDLSATKVTDAGLKDLAALKKLESLNLVGTKVTADGVRKLQAVLPSCKIVSDFPQSLPDKEKPFVLVRADGKNRVECRTLEEALFVLQNGDAIEVHGNGPFRVSARLNGKALNLRAAAGYRPKLRLQNRIEVNGGLLIDGCDIICPGMEAPFGGAGGPWEFRNCRVWSPNFHGNLVTYSGPRLTFEDCMLASGHWTLVHLGPSTPAEVQVTNCILPIRTAACIHGQGSGKITVRLRNNTLLAGVDRTVVSRHPDAPPISVEAESNIFGSLPVATSGKGKTISTWETSSSCATATRSCMAWPPGKNAGAGTNKAVAKPTRSCSSGKTRN